MLTKFTMPCTFPDSSYAQATASPPAAVCKDYIAHCTCDLAGVQRHNGSQTGTCEDVPAVVGREGQ